ncbi:Voltage-gated ion channel, partial [Globisporangium polare]
MTPPGGALDGIQESASQESLSRTQRGGTSSSLEGPSVPEVLRKRHSGLKLRQNSFSARVARRQSSFSGLLRRKQDAPTPLRRTALPMSKSSSLMISSTPRSGSGAAAALADKIARYEEMMERFQVRRLMHTASADAAKAGGDNVQQDVSVSNLRQVRPAQSRRASFDATAMADYRVQNSQQQSPASHYAVSDTESTPSPQQEGIDSVGFKYKEPIDDFSSSANGLVTTGNNVAASTWVPTKIAGRFSLHRKLMAWKRNLYQRAGSAVEQLQTPLSPVSILAHARNAVIVLALTWYIVYHPLELAFPTSSTPWLQSIDGVREILLLGNVLLMFNTSFQNERGELVTSRLEIAKHYLRGW